MIVLALMVAGGVGALARYGQDTLITRRWHPTVPWATMSINVVGSLALGILAGLVLHHGVAPEWETVLGTGFCGGYTTFSTASVDSARLAQQRRTGPFAFYVLGTLLLSAAACAAGLALARLG